MERSVRKHGGGAMEGPEQLVVLLEEQLGDGQTAELSGKVERGLGLEIGQGRIGAFPQQQPCRFRVTVLRRKVQRCVASFILCESGS